LPTKEEAGGSIVFIVPVSRFRINIIRAVCYQHEVNKQVHGTQGSRNRVTPLTLIRVPRELIRKTITFL
jgi:hypothetical protein